MKKLILMTSALTLIGGAAAAEIAFTAETSLSYGNWDTAAGDAVFAHNSTLTATLSETTASGVSYGGSVELEIDDGDDGVVSHGSLWVSTNGLKLAFGVDAFEEIEDAAEDEAGDLQLTYSTGGVSVTLTAETDLGADSTVDWDLILGYTTGAITVGLEGDSTDLWALTLAYDAGNFAVGAGFDTDSDWDVWASTTLGPVNAKVAYDSDDVINLDLDGTSGAVTWALGYETDSDTATDDVITASLGYGMGDFSVGLAYDSSNSGGFGDDAETVVTVGYAISDMATAQLLLNDQSEYELSLTLGFAF